MKLSNQGSVPVYTIAGASTARPLPEWLARKRKRSLKQDPEYANRIELLQDFEFEEASSCVRVSEDGDWVMSTGKDHGPWCRDVADADRYVMNRHIQTTDPYTLSPTSFPLLRTTHKLSEPDLPPALVRL